MEQKAVLSSRVTLPVTGLPSVVSDWRSPHQRLQPHVACMITALLAASPQPHTDVQASSGRPQTSQSSFGPRQRGGCRRHRSIGPSLAANSSLTARWTARCSPSSPASLLRPSRSRSIGRSTSSAHGSLSPLAPPGTGGWPIAASLDWWIMPLSYAPGTSDLVSPPQPEWRAGHPRR